MPFSEFGPILHKIRDLCGELGFSMLPFNMRWYNGHTYRGLEKEIGKPDLMIIITNPDYPDWIGKGSYSEYIYAQDNDIPVLFYHSVNDEKWYTEDQAVMDKKDESDWEAYVCFDFFSNRSSELSELFRRDDSGVITETISDKDHFHSYQMPVSDGIVIDTSNISTFDAQSVIEYYQKVGIQVIETYDSPENSLSLYYLLI